MEEEFSKLNNSAKENQFQNYYYDDYLSAPWPPIQQDDPQSEYYEDIEPMLDFIYPEIKLQNVATLGIVLVIALTVNLIALPVILFRRTKFGNGLFAVLILCLTIADLSVVLFNVLGSLIVEASHFLWGGAPGSCKVYHWLSAWLSGLSAYLLVAIIGMVMAKASTWSCLKRLRDCRWLLLALLVTSGLYALPELFIRTTVDLGIEGIDFCILGAVGIEYNLYVAFRITVRHIIPLILVIATILRPETKISRRVSHLFFGHLSTPCNCGEAGKALSIPHECPMMQSAMLRNQQHHHVQREQFKNGKITTHILVPSTISERPVAPPDIVMDSEHQNFHTIASVTNCSESDDSGIHREIVVPSPTQHNQRLNPAKVHINCSSSESGSTTTATADSSAGSSSAANATPATPLRASRRRRPCGRRCGKSPMRIYVQPEDRHRRKYKLILATNFILATLINLVLDIVYQVQSSHLTANPEEISDEVEVANHAENLTTAMYAFAHLQQIGDAIIFLLAEFYWDTLKTYLSPRTNDHYVNKIHSGCQKCLMFKVT